MALGDGEVGLERGATKLTWTTSPKIITRYREGGPERAVALSLVGTPIVTEYTQDQDRRELVIRVEVVTEAQMNTLLTLLDGTGPVTCKILAAGTTTFNVAFGPRSKHKIEPIIGSYPENAPTANDFRAHRVELQLWRL